MSRHAAPQGRRAPAPVVPPTPTPVVPAIPTPVASPVPVGGSGREARPWPGIGFAVLVGGGLAASALGGRPGVAVGVALVQALFVPVWVLGLHRPGRIGATLLGLSAAAAADVALLAHDRTSPAALLAVLGFALPLMVVHQLARGVVRVRVTESLSGAAVCLTAVLGLATLLALSRAADGPRLVGVVALAAGAGLAVARGTDALAPVPRIAADLPYGLLAVLLAAAAGAGTGAALAVPAIGAPAAPVVGALALPVVGALVGALAALVSVGVGFVAATLPDARPVPLGLLGAVVPIALVAPVGYLVALSVAG